ncbi:kinase-like protein [Myriangium duriaei CBS 260.36]|uniref:Autophagy-related protein 1 n=1 Tax=Myriangium duriaei CBS 260.36 TaxID=1168546 RepID=A0A9P4IV02_9PEZI|nr:kinase-like protein [Myriangium duriaei CBS 260.36]
MSLNPLLEHYRVPVAECASDDGSTLWQRRSEPLGRGAYGEVWLEENISEGKLRAVKTVRNPTSGRSQINAEVFALINLSQRRYRPFFGEFMGFYEDESSISFFMEYFEKQDLRKHLPEGGELPEDQAKTIIRQVLHGVRAMHEQNFTHRDLKPENIFVVSVDPWRVKIGDFGVAKKLADERALLQTKVGTEQYMAPEIFCFVGDDDQSLGNYSDSVDIWSCGVILFEMLTGERPFPTHAKLKAYCDGRYPFPDSSLELSGITAQGANLVRSLLRAQPVDRPSAVEALQDPWLESGPDFRTQSPRVGSHKSPALRTSSTPRSHHSGSPRIPSLSSGPPVKPLPVPPPQKFPSRSSSTRFRDEGYHTSSDRDVQEMVDFIPPAISEKSEKRRLHSTTAPNIQEWRTNVEPPPRQEMALFPRQQSPRSSPPIRPPRPDAQFCLPVRHMNTPESASTRFEPSYRSHQSEAAVEGLGIPRVGSTSDSQMLADFYGLAPSRDMFQEPVPPVNPTAPVTEEDSDADQLGPLSSAVTSDPYGRHHQLSRTATNRSESVLSFQSATSSTAEVRESVSQKIRDGQWKVNDIIVLLQVSKWDLMRISAHSIKSAAPPVLIKNLHKDYINELPKLIFDALKPWFADNLGAKGTGKALSKDESSYQQKIRDDILPYVDLHASEPEYYRVQLPKSIEVLEISKNIEGGALRIPASTVKQVIREHWRLYLEEYINGFLYNDRATLGRSVRAIVFDEPAHDYAQHEQFYKERLGKKLPKSIEYCNYENFRKFADKTEKIKDETAKKPSKFGKWRMK